MADLPQERVLLSRPCHYSLPDDLRFVGLGQSQGREIIRIRFSRGAATILDIPLSAETLCELARTLAPLHGSIPQEVAENLADLQQKGLRVEK